MRKSRFSEEQIIGILKQAEAGVAMAELCRRTNGARIVNLASQGMPA